MTFLRAQHAKQITHYKNLLVRAQSASSASLHELHQQLHDLQSRYNDLQAEHARCGDWMRMKREVFEDKAAESIVKRTVKEAIQDWDSDERIRLLGLVVESEEI